MSTTILTSNTTSAGENPKSKATKKPYIHLSKLLNILEDRVHSESDFDYYIPALWDLWDLDDRQNAYCGEINVNPYVFFSDLIKSIVAKYDEEDYANLLFLTQTDSKTVPYKNENAREWIKCAQIYSLMVRTSTTWDHNKNNAIEPCNSNNITETGTFLKTLSLLPLLLKMGVNTIYLLPIFKRSMHNKKGELGSPYSVSNFFVLDETLSDSMVSDEMSVDEQFKAFVEACHLLNIRVIIDIIPRTNAIDSDLILEHPDWFYWIRCDEMHNYGPPRISELGSNTSSTVRKNIEISYSSTNLWSHINKFSFNPSVIDKSLWEHVCTLKRDTPTLNFLHLVEKYFGITIAPAFSDCINDPQPPWNDVTFFRMYLDHPLIANKFIGAAEYPPYITSDTIKSNLYPGNIPNTPLWEMLSNVIPYYQKEFAIDGARIDMGHALPNTLTSKIISNARKINSSFCFIAEELNPINAPLSKEAGYDLIVGNQFMHVYNINAYSFTEYIKSIRSLPLPVLALTETHDTPRIASKVSNDLVKMLSIFNLYIPNSLPFINSGQEVYELQPMNTGINCSAHDLESLDCSDPFFKKLALFDKYAFHYTNSDSFDFIMCMEKASKIRGEFMDAIVYGNSFSFLSFVEEDINVAGFMYSISSKHNLIIIGNFDTSKGTDCHISFDLKRNVDVFSSREAKLLFSTHGFSPSCLNFDNSCNLQLYLDPCELKIILT